MEGGRKALLNLIGNMKTKLMELDVGTDFPIPQFILIGAQSVGKSRLIEALAGECFNFISGTLGSRRPTVLEFRNDLNLSKSRWYIMNSQSKEWVFHDVNEVMHIIGQAHESLGNTCSETPVFVRLESADCVDMQIVDLPGFRDFANDKAKQKLADMIAAMVTKFMKDERNFMICVEECCDAANLSTLARCKKVDPHFKRTLLVRNKLDKYFRDLTPDNINEWLNGYGDLPTDLQKFALTLPNWKDGQVPPAPFAELRKQMNDKDVTEMQSKGVSAKFKSNIGFDNFARALETRIEKLFAASIQPISEKLHGLDEKWNQRSALLKEEAEDCDGEDFLNRVRAVGVTFAQALPHVMDGFLASTVGKMTLTDELEMFHEYCAENNLHKFFDVVPSEDFGDLQEYLDYLRDEGNCPGYDCEINGGAQFRRLQYETEVYFRFAEVCTEVTKKDVVQARGVSLGTVTWMDCTVKLLRQKAPQKTERHVRYVAERIRWFYSIQKEAIVDFMSEVDQSSESRLFSKLFGTRGRMLKENDVIRSLVYNRYELVLERQKAEFLSHFCDTIHSMLQNPKALLKASSMPRLTDECLDDVCLPSFEDTKARIPEEIQLRAAIENYLKQTVNSIPDEEFLIDEAIDKVSALCVKTFSFVRAMIADQMELFCISFYQLPMFRRLEADMMEISLNDVDVDAQLDHAREVRKEYERITKGIDSIKWCHESIKQFSLMAGKVR
eukprot:GEMP01010348.1.p1 GENE.GEMP01010348.1~~GEMP01010348.1.p1  ORF type:complete len:726 (+),score=148.66 GEMP01010348.1:83-2260(+)